ncbi:hypothetical protein GWK47_032883 [Chionoecetes opilio]|uniref:Uncharacterized protein n=1 Tax=Chionoecetes opilio TaxID=41210 RepID=A0A8J4YVT0_CHIOP|nr:hypothetical protein GWK47_032883 [Chionoecetes opilio]
MSTAAAAPWAASVPPRAHTGSRRPGWSPLGRHRQAAAPRAHIGSRHHGWASQHGIAATPRRTPWVPAGAGLHIAMGAGGSSSTSTWGGVGGSLSGLVLRLRLGRLLVSGVAVSSFLGAGAGGGGQGGASSRLVCCRGAAEPGILLSLAGHRRFQAWCPALQLGQRGTGRSPPSRRRRMQSLVACSPLQTPQSSRRRLAAEAADSFLHILAYRVASPASKVKGGGETSSHCQLDLPGGQ